MSEEKKIVKVAIIGAGVMGTLHARIYSKLPFVKLIAVCDIDNLNASKLCKLYKIKQYPDYKKLISNELLDAVSITVPTKVHKEIAIYCIEHGINILVEKPLAKTLGDAASIVKAAQKRSVILGVGHVERFNPAVIKLGEFIRSGELGRIVSVVIKRVGLFPPRIKDVNVVTDLAVHDLDIVCNLLQKTPKSIFATGGKGVNANHIDYADIFLDFGMTSCYLQVNWITPIKIRSLSITGTLGYCELDYVTQELYVYKTSQSNVLPKEFNRFVEWLGRPQKKIVKITKEEPLKLEIINFIDSVIKKTPPFVTGKDGMFAVKLSELVLESLSRKKVIHL